MVKKEKRHPDIKGECLWPPEQEQPDILIDDRDPSNINILDVTISVFFDDATDSYRVDVVHNPTGIYVSENSQFGIHRNRRLAMKRLSEELELRRRK